MGLDIYVWKAKKISKEEATKLDNLRSEDIPDTYTVLFCGDKDNPAIKAIAPYCRKIKLQRPYVDVKKIACEHGIEEPLHIGGACYSKTISYSLYDDRGNRRLEVEYTPEELNEKYTRYQTEDCLVTHKLEEAYCWRRAHDLNEAVRNACAFLVDNCGYYRLTVKMLNAIRKYDESAYRELKDIKNNLAPDEQLFYHIWF